MSVSNGGSAAAPVKRLPLSKGVWYVVAVLTLVHIVASLDRFLMGVVIVPLKVDLALSDTQLGLLYGLGFALLYCIAGLPAGRMADSYNRRNIILIGGVIWTCATAACAFTSTFSGLFGARLLVGLSEATLVPAAVSLLGAYVAREWLGTTNALFFMGVTIGKALAFIGGGVALAFLVAQGGMQLIGHHFAPWQGLFVLATIPGILAIVLMATVKEPKRAVVKTGNEPSYKALLSYIKDNAKAYTLFLIAATSINMIGHTLAAWVPSFYFRAYHMDIAHAAIVTGVVSVVLGPVGAILGGYFTDKLGSKGVHEAPVIAVLFALIVIIPSAWFAFSGVLPLIFSLVAYSLVHTMVLLGTPQGWVGVQMLTPLRYRGMMSAIFLAITSLISVGLGPLLIGLWSDYLFVDSNNPLGYAVILTAFICACVGIVSGLAARRVFSKVIAAQKATEA